MKRLVLFVSLVFTLTAPLYALGITQPSDCPTIAALQAVGVNDAENLMGWFASSQNNFDTPDQWVFAILVGQAKDKNDAIKRGNKRIGLLSIVEGPRAEGNDTWSCLYSNKSRNIIAFAITPIDNPLNFLKYLK